jgi:hypothetical protein
MKKRLISMVVVFAMSVSLLTTAQAIGYLDGTEASVINNPNGVDIIPANDSIGLSVTTVSVPVTVSERFSLDGSCTCYSINRCNIKDWENMSHFWLAHLPSGAELAFLCGSALSFEVKPHVQSVQTAKPWIVTNSTRYTVTVEDFGDSSEVQVYVFAYSETLGKVHAFEATLTPDNPSTAFNGQSSGATMTRMFGATIDGTENATLTITDKPLSETTATPPTATTTVATPVSSPPVILSNNSFGGSVGIPLSITLTTDSATPVTWTATGVLPDGLRLDENFETNGKISGTPTMTESTMMYVTASNQYGSSQTLWLNISIGGSATVTTAPPTTTASINTTARAGDDVRCLNCGTIYHLHSTGNRGVCPNCKVHRDEQFAATTTTTTTTQPITTTSKKAEIAYDVVDESIRLSWRNIRQQANGGRWLIETANSLDELNAIIENDFYNENHAEVVIEESFFEDKSVLVLYIADSNSPGTISVESLTKDNNTITISGTVFSGTNVAVSLNRVILAVNRNDFAEVNQLVWERITPSIATTTPTTTTIATPPITTAQPTTTIAPHWVHCSECYMNSVLAIIHVSQPWICKDCHDSKTATTPPAATTAPPVSYTPVSYMAWCVECNSFTTPSIPSLGIGNNCNLCKSDNLSVTSPQLTTENPVTTVTTPSPATTAISPAITEVNPTISDALEILKFLAKLPSAYCNTGLTPDISHALDILKYLAKLEPTVNWVRPSVTTTGGTPEPATTPPTTTTSATTTTEEVTTATETPTEPSEPSETTVATPRFPPLEPLSEEMELRIRQDWVDLLESISDTGHRRDIEDVSISLYLGTYKGNVVVVMDFLPWMGQHLIYFYGKMYRIASAAPINVWNDGFVCEVLFGHWFEPELLPYREVFSEQDIEEIFYRYPVHQDPR